MRLTPPSVMRFTQMIGRFGLPGILKSTFWISTGSLFQKGAILFATLTLTRSLPVEEFGRLMYVVSFLAFFSASSDMGLYPIAMRELSAERGLLARNTLWHRFLSLRISLSPIALIGLVILIFLNQNVRGLVQLGTWILLYSYSYVLVDFLCLRFRTDEKVHFEAIAKTLGSAMLAAGILFWARSGAALSPAAVLYAASGLVSMLLVLIFLRMSSIRNRWHWDRSFAIVILRQALPVAASALLLQAFTKIDSIMVYNIAGEKAAGGYQLCVSIVLFVVFALNFLHIASLPRMAQKANAQDPRRKMAVLYAVFSFTLGLFFYAVLAFTGERLIPFVFGSKYQNLMPLLQRYALFLPSLAGLNVLNYYFLVVKQYSILVRLYLIACLCSPLTYMALKHAGTGAAALTVSGIGFLVFCYGIYSVAHFRAVER